MPTLPLPSTWNVAKLTSEISSSSITCRATGGNVVESGFMLLIAGDVLLASVSDNPAAPSTGMGLIRRFRRAACVVCGMISLLCLHRAVPA